MATGARGPSPYLPPQPRAGLPGPHRALPSGPYRLFTKGPLPIPARPGLREGYPAVAHGGAGLGAHALSPRHSAPRGSGAAGPLSRGDYPAVGPRKNSSIHPHSPLTLLIGAANTFHVPAPCGTFKASVGPPRLRPYRPLDSPSTRRGLPGPRAWAREQKSPSRNPATLQSPSRSLEQKWAPKKDGQNSHLPLRGPKAP